MFKPLIKRNDDAAHIRIEICGIKFSKRRNLQSCYTKSQKYYQKILKNLVEQIKIRPIRVIFLVTEKQKWGYQSLYENLLTDKYFEPIIVVSCITQKHKNPNDKRCSVEDNIEFFKSKGISVECAYVRNKYIPLEKFKPDIIFYQQPWGLPELHSPSHLSKYALCCYCSYSIAASKSGSEQNPIFFYNIWKYFLAHECMIDEYKSWMKYNIEALHVTGHPKLDVYQDYKEDLFNQEKHYVIYAPHFSIGKSILNFATFDWSGQFMLEYAKRHPEINWVFKPHPQLRHAFINSKYMTENELDDYFNMWSKVGMVYENGDYFDIFKDSDAMITDCGSFCVEYFFTGKPLLHLISENSKPHSALNRLVNKNHYSIFNKETLEKYLDEILIKKNDFLKNVRQNALKEIFGEKQSSARNIISYLKEELGI